MNSLKHFLSFRCPVWLTTLIGVVIGTSITTFIGNRGEEVITFALTKLWGKVIATASDSFWLTIGISTGIFLVMGSLLLIRQRAHSILSKRLTMEDSFIRLLGTLDIRANNDDSLKQLVRAYLEHIVEFLQDQGIEGCATIVYRPAPGLSNTLETWVNDGRAAANEITQTYDIASHASDQACGIIGKTFQDGKMHYGAVKQQDRQWGIVNEEGQTVQKLTHKPAYWAKVAIPIKDDTGSIGVLCIYTGHLRSLQQPGMDTFLPSFSNRLAIAIQIANKNSLVNANP